MIEAVKNLRWEWRRQIGPGDATPIPDGSDHALAEAGRGLSQDFLAGEVGKALVGAVAAAAGANEVLELSLDVDDELADLPWETLQLPGLDGEIPAAASPRPRPAPGRCPLPPGLGPGSHPRLQDPGTPAAAAECRAAPRGGGAAGRRQQRLLRAPRAGT